MPKQRKMREKINLQIVYNSIFIDLLKQLEKLMRSKGEYFRARAYNRARSSIEGVKGDITNIDHIKLLPNIGVTIVKKFTEYVETGKISLLEREKDNPIIKLTDVHGIGPKKAQELVDKHKIDSIETLKEHPELLNETQIKGLKYYDDIIHRIPRDEIDVFKTLFDKVFDKVKTPTSKYEIVGSYRRNAPDSGDIDVIITGETPKIYSDFMGLLISEGIVVDTLTHGKTKSLAVGIIPTMGPIKTPMKVRRLDFLYAKPDEYAFTILYFTGSASFNTSMRLHALDQGLSLSEHFFTIKNSNPKKKVERFFADEKSIFDFLNLEYKNPHERIDSRSIVKKKLKKKRTIKKKAPMTVRRLIKSFKTEGISLLDVLTVEKLIELVETSNDAYFNDHPILTDNEFDIIKEYTERRELIELKKTRTTPAVFVGAPIKRGKVKLPYIMASMDKIKPDTRALPQWKSKFNGGNVISAKLDGVSGLFSTETGVAKLYTRGNGIDGQDVSHIIPHIPSLAVLTSGPQITIRGEFIISKEDFENDYATESSNPRNFVSGIVNSKHSDNYGAVDFIAYEVIRYHDQTDIKPSEQFKLLTTNKIPCVHHETMPSNKKLTNNYLSELLICWRGSYMYEIDGIIVADDQVYTRETDVKNPEHAFAFKMILSDQMAEAKVTDVLWSASKDGFLKPKIRIEPVTIGGATIEYATAFNAGYVVEQKIGIGALIKIIRSGDVIPIIHEVVVPAETVKLPDVEWKWNSTKIDIVLNNPEENPQVILKRIAHFFRGIKVTGLGEGLIKKLIDSGFATIPEIVTMDIDDFMEIDGFKETLANKIHKNIFISLRDASVLTLMSVSNLFGRGMGERKMALVLKTYPDILKSLETIPEKIEKLNKIKGFSEKTATQFVNSIDEFVDFMKELGIYKKKIKSPHNPQIVSDHPLSGKKIVFTCFRDSVLEKKLIQLGAQLGASVTKSTHCLIVKDKAAISQDSTKANKARSFGIMILDKKSFISKYIYG